MKKTQKTKKKMMKKRMKTGMKKTGMKKGVKSHGPMFRGNNLNKISNNLGSIFQEDKKDMKLPKKQINNTNIKNRNNNSNEMERRELSGSQKHFFMDTYIDKCLRNVTLESPQKEFPRYKTEAEYLATFGEIEEFVNRISEDRKRAINYVFYHVNNSDGYFSAYCAWDYKTNGGKIPNVSLTIRAIQTDNVPGKPSFKMTRLENEIRGANVLVVDLACNEATMDYLHQVTRDFIIIDDHPDITTSKKYPNNVFSGRGHSACAYTYKLFHPQTPVPKIYQYVDSDDNKMYLSYLPYIRQLNVALDVRVIKNDFFVRKRSLDKVYGGGFNALHDLLEYNNTNMLIAMGTYMVEIQENFKFAIAKNAYYTKWMGFNVGILNFEASGLTKPVGRQILSDMKEQGRPVDFSIVWCYHHPKQQYRLQIMEEHIGTHKPKILSLIKYIVDTKQCDYITGQQGGSMFLADVFLKGEGPNAPPPIKWMEDHSLSQQNIARFRPDKN